MVFLVIALLSLSVGLVVSIVPVLCIGWGGLGGYEISGVSSHSPLECGFGYSGLLHRRVSIQFVLLILIYVIFDVEVVLLSGLLCSWYSDIVGYKVLVYIGLTLWLETMLGKVMWFTCPVWGYSITIILEAIFCIRCWWYLRGLYVSCSCGSQDSSVSINNIGSSFIFDR